MTVIMDVALLLGAWVFALLTRRYMLALMIVFGLMVVDVFRFGMANSILLCGGMLLMLWLIIKETTHNKDDSVIVKYNPLHEGNKIPRRIRIIILCFILIAVFIRILSFVVHTKERGGLLQ